MKNNFNPETFLDTLFQLDSNEIEKAAVELFKFQYINNSIYHDYCNLLETRIDQVKTFQDIPFLPISFFKSHKVATTKFNPETTFSSSGTSGSINSQHYIKDLKVYEESFKTAFNLFYGDVKEYRILALLPSYLERKGSSLIYMANKLIQESGHKMSGFFLHDTERLNRIINQLASENKKTILIGVSFALLNFVENHQTSENSNLIVMETGGMKGRRKELIREELHSTLQKGFKTNTIHSEYGMTELLSQAYSKGLGKFQFPPWMKVLIRKYDDPFSYTKTGTVGGLNVIDLANIYSCAFIQTDDLGRKIDENYFQVLGRFDTSELRGCNLMSN